MDNYGIIHKLVIEGINATPEDIDEDETVLLKLSKNKKSLLLVNASAFHTMTPEAIQRIKSASSKSRHATALVSKSLGVRIFTKTINSLPQGGPPFRMFDTEKEAIKWLLSFKKSTVAKLRTPPAKIRLKNPGGNQSCKVHIDKNGILTKKIFKGAHVNIESARKAEKEAAIMAGGKKMLTLIDRRASYTITPAAIKYFEKNAVAKYRLATALISSKSWYGNTSSPKPNTPPLRTFSNKATAVKWLLSLEKRK